MNLIIVNETICKCDNKWIDFTLGFMIGGNGDINSNYIIGDFAITNV